MKLDHTAIRNTLTDKYKQETYYTDTKNTTAKNKVNAINI